MLAVLLSFLVLGSIWTPCDDEAEHQNQTEINSDQEHEGEHEEEICSPFCTCQCCHSNTYQPHLIELYSIIESESLILAHTPMSNEDWVFKEDQPPRQF